MIRKSSGGFAVEPGVPNDLPEVSVEVAEVAGVDAPRAVVRRACACRAGRLGLGEERVYVCPACHEMADAELARLRRPERHIRVLGQLQARAEAEEKSAVEAEDRDGSGRVVVVTGELRSDHAGRVQPEA